MRPIGVSLFNGLYCALFLGIVELVPALIEMKCCDLNGGGSRGCTPLSWAAKRDMRRW